MGLNDFLSAVGRVGSRGKGKANSPRVNAHVSDFNRDQLENAASSMQQSEPGALGSFLDNLGSFFRPAGTFAAAATDYVGGDGTLTEGIKRLRKGSELYRGSDFQKAVTSLPIVGDIVDTGLRAPTGDFSKTSVGQGLGKLSELISGVPSSDYYLSDKFKDRVAQATESTGFNDVARSIAENRQGQRKENLVERTLGKLPAVGGYFDRYQPSVEDRAVEAGATPAQAAFISMLNPLEWLNAESKTSAASKLEGASNLRKAVNRVASPIVDPLQAGLDWALPGKARTLEDVAQSAPPVAQAKPVIDSAPKDSFQQQFANFLGKNVEDLPVEQVDALPKTAVEQASPVVDAAAKPVLEEAQAAPLGPSTGEAIAPSSPLEDFLNAIAPPEAPLAKEAVQEASAPVVEDASGFRGIETFDPETLAAAKPHLDKPGVVEALKNYDAAIEARDVEGALSARAAIEEAVKPAPVQSVPPNIAAARAALNDPNIGDAVDAIDEAAPFFALEKPSSRPLMLTEKIDTIVNAVEDAARGGAEPGTSIDIATKPTQKAVSEKAAADVERLAALEKSIETVKNSDLPPVQRRKKLAALQQEVIAIQGKLTESTAPKYSMKLMGGIPLPTYDNVKALGADIKAAWDYFMNKSPLRQTLKYLPEESQRRVLGSVLSQSEFEKGGWKYLAEDVVAHPKIDTGDIAVAARRLDEEISATRQRRTATVMPVFGGVPLPTGQQLAFFADSLKGLSKKFADNTVELRASLSRFFSSTTLGKVDAKTVAAVRDGAEANEHFNRALVDAYQKTLRGDIGGIVGRAHAGTHEISLTQRAAIRDFMGGRVVNGVKVDEQALLDAGIHPEVIESSKIVRSLVDQMSDNIMAEQYALPKVWFNKLNDEQRKLVAGLAQTANKPRSRKAFEKSVDPKMMSFLDEARQTVDAGFEELSKAGHWLDGEDPRDMVLQWAPYLANRGTYQPLLYRFFEADTLDKGADALKLYLDKFRVNGGAVSPELEAFLHADWMKSGSAGKGIGSELDRIRKRNPNMPQELKELLSEIEDPAYAYAKGIMQMNKLKTNLQMRRWLASQERFVSGPGESLVDFLRRTGYKPEEVATLGENVGANTRNFGAMAGRHVHGDFWDLAYQVHAIPGSSQGTDWALRFHKEVMQRWKFWHTVANPSSHIRQGAQNAYSIWNAGGLAAIGNIKAAVTDYKNTGKFYKMAREHGLLSGKSLHDIADRIDDEAWSFLKFNSVESFIARFGKFGEAIAKQSEAFRRGDGSRLISGKGAANAWQLVDEVARISLLKTLTDRGWPVKEAAEAVKGEVYSGVRRGRADMMASGIPLTSTFANVPTGWKGGVIRGVSAAQTVFNIPFWGAQRFIMEQTLRGLTGMKPGTWKPFSDPMRMARTLGTVYAMVGLYQLGQNAEGLQPADQVAQVPDYLRPFIPSHFRVGDKTMSLLDGEGKVGYVDMSWLFPWGNLAAGGFNAKTGSMESRGLAPSGAMSFVSPLWKPVIEIANNKDTFREEIGARSEIYSPLDTGASKARKSAAHAWRSWLPPWAPNMAGGVADALRYDGGADEKVDAREAMRAFFQGVAKDSGHTASKLASGIYNSFDYWYDKKFPDGQERLQVSDYMGREQYLVKAIADALAIKITSVDQAQIEKRRDSARTLAVKEMQHYYRQQRALTKNPASIRRIDDEESSAIRRIREGKPVPRWYDETPEDTWVNVRSFWADKLERLRRKSQ